MRNFNLFKKATPPPVVPPFLPPVFKVQPKFELEEAFTCENVRTFTPKDIKDIPATRGLMAHVFYREVEMRYSLADLERETQMEETILSRPKFTVQDIVDLKMMIRARRERMMMPVETETLYRLASVTYIDEGEHPYEYDHTYNSTVKIPRWKRNPEMLDFFLKSPLIGLHGFLQQQGLSTQDFLKLCEEIKQFQEAVYHQISSKQQQPESKEKESPSRAGSPPKSTTRPSVF